MRTLLSALLTGAVLLLPQAPADAKPDQAARGDGGAEVQITATPECRSADQLTVVLVVRNTGSQVLHIDPPVRGGLRVPPRDVRRFWGYPAPGFDVIEPGGQVRFEVPFDAEQPGAFDAQRITFWVDFRFDELKRPVIRHTSFPGCS